jgi:hypothetical protein
MNKSKREQCTHFVVFKKVFQILSIGRYRTYKFYIIFKGRVKKMVYVLHDRDLHDNDDKGM